MVVILLTLADDWTVLDALERLGISRTRFQDLRRQMLEGALLALEPGRAGRPRKCGERESARVRDLESTISALSQELRVVQTRLELSEGPAAEAVRARMASLGSKGGGR